MALKVLADGTVVIKTVKDARKALEAFQELKAERDELYEEHLAAIENDLVAYKASVTHWMNDNKVEQIQCDGFHGTMVKAHYDPHWIADDDDLANEPELSREIVPLQKIIEKKFKSKITQKGSKARKVWMRITKRVIDPKAIEDAVADKVFTVDEISPAWVEKEKTPYLRIFEDA